MSVRQKASDRQSRSLSVADQRPDPDQPRWSDRQVAVMLVLQDATARAQRLGLPGWYVGSFREQCRAIAAHLGRFDAGRDRASWWVGIDDDPVDLDQFRGLPPELRHLRRPWGGAA